MIILGISCFYHDSSACIIRDGKILACIAEERLSRIKHDNTFPFLAIEFCLQTAGIAINQVDYLVFYEKPIVKFARLVNQYLEGFPKSFSLFYNSADTWLTQRLKIREYIKENLLFQGKVLFVPHHLSHAASAYYISPYSSATIVTLDGVGEWATTTIGYAQEAKIEITQEIRFPHSLGLLYSTLTAFLGFQVNNDEYKVMGLAGYGNKKRYIPEFSELLELHPDGSFSLNMEYFTYTYSNTRMFSEKMSMLFGCKPRVPESQMQSQYEDIAAGLQYVLEEAVFHVIRHAHKKHPHKNLCFSGGVALNSVANSKIQLKTPFKQLFIPPDPGDAGGAMGSALAVHHMCKSKKEQQHFTPFLGPEFEWFQIGSLLEKYNLPYTFLPKKKLLSQVARLLEKQYIVGWFQGRMEWGPRALGNRSILASARTASMRDIINEKVKHREMFRPFAPVILKEYVQEYFVTPKELSISTDYMLCVYPFKQRGYKDVPATVHVDGTGRLQTLSRNDNPLYYDLIAEYHKLTGVPIIINTSFNVRGEPIVCTPQDAINCFLSTDIDYLVIDQYIVAKTDLNKSL